MAGQRCLAFRSHGLGGDDRDALAPTRVTNFLIVPEARVPPLSQVRSIMGEIRHTQGSASEAGKSRGSRDVAHKLWRTTCHFGPKFLGRRTDLRSHVALGGEVFAKVKFFGCHVGATACDLAPRFSGLWV